ncbi:MAG: hypothetical protein HUU34_06130 [Saprospiraceae bacterium]|jgi:hypothetical protein|nr:hypothetical protein [Saprospiraceae bacterium]
METRVIEYKTVCEVHILHDYYLIDNEYQSYFALSNLQQQAWLSRKLQLGQYDISRNIGLLINRDAAKQLADFRLKILPNPLGFKLAMEVNSQQQPDGSVRYRPVIQIPDGTALTIGLQTINPLFANFTNIALRPSDNQIYFFTNDGAHHERSLSRPIPAFAPGQSYNMGDLSTLGAQVRQATEDNSGDLSKWEPVAGNGFVNEADRTLDTQTIEYTDWQLGFSTPIAKPLGHIKLLFHCDNSDFTLISPDGFLQTMLPVGSRRAVHPRFELRFLSRSAFWRYAKKGGFDAAEISSINTHFSSWLEQSGEVFVTLKPRYFAQVLTVFDPGQNPLPNAEPNYLRREGARLYSDVYFNAVQPVPR